MNHSPEETGPSGTCPTKGHSLDFRKILFHISSKYNLLFLVLLSFSLNGCNPFSLMSQHSRRIAEFDVEFEKLQQEQTILPPEYVIQSPHSGSHYKDSEIEFFKEQEKEALKRPIEQPLTPYTNEPESSIFYYGSKGTDSAAQQQFDLALRYYDKLLELDPTNNGVLLEHAKVLMSKKDYSKALEGFDRAIENSKIKYGESHLLRTGQGYVYRCEIFLGQKNYEMAILEANRFLNQKHVVNSLALKEMYCSAYTYKAWALLQQKKLSEALESAEYALKESDQSTTAHYIKGQIHYQQGDFKVGY